MSKFNAGDRVYVVCRSEDLGTGCMGESYEQAISLQDAGVPLIIDSCYDNDSDALIVGLNWFLLEQLEHWVEPNVNRIKIKLSEYEASDALTEEDKLVIKDYVKKNNLQELNVNLVV